jgi:N-acetylmuramoyl-L-alanine amidase
LRRGDRGEGVRDLQQRLAALDLDLAGDELGSYGPATESAVRALQQRRGLAVDGICGRETWSAVVESGFALGDRMLYFRQPMLRGDDVVALQRRLNRLGFDAGREDGILGEDTVHALGEFQRNAGLARDGICGIATIEALDRLDTLAEGSVAAVRERDALRRAPRRLDDQRVYVAVTPGLDALGDDVTRGLSGAGAHVVLDASGAPDSTIASTANQYGADLFLALRAGAVPHRASAYFASGTFRSEGGYHVAAALHEELAGVLAFTETSACGRTYDLLRETRMAAVVCDLIERGDVDAMRRLVASSGSVARSIVRGVRRGIEAPPD